jgi:hypothetical protein
MSGYLQRLAVSAQSPQRRLRPMLGSIFAHAPDEPIGAAPPAPFLERGATRHAAAPAPARDSAPARRGRLAPQEVQAQTSRADAVPGPQSTSVLPSGDDASDLTPPERPTPRVPVPAEPSPERLVEVWREAPNDAPAFRPRPIAEQLRPSTAPIPRRSLSGPAPEADAQERDTREDVHIHIGRIEVIAAQPPAPAAPVRRRSTDLKDYLKRSSGRTR